MNKQIISFAIATTLVTGSVLADELIPNQASPNTHRNQAIGLGVGSVAGVLIAGPAGLVAGGIVGSLIGWSGGLQADLDDRQQELENSRAELATLESQNRLLVAQTGDITSLPAWPESDARGELGKMLSADLGLDIYFRSGSAQIEPFYEQRLVSISAMLNAFPRLSVELDGYTDRRGTEQDNVQLSSQRLDSVKTALMAAGVDPRRILSQAQGESQPVSRAGDAQAYAFDRRVQLRISLKQPEPDAPMAALETTTAITQ